MGGRSGHRRPPRHACARDQHWGHGFRSRFGRTWPSWRPSARRACMPDAGTKRLPVTTHRRREPARPLAPAAGRAQALGRFPYLLERVPTASRRPPRARRTPPLHPSPLSGPRAGTQSRRKSRGAIDTTLRSRARSGGSAASSPALVHGRDRFTCNERAAMSASQSGSSRFPGMGGGRAVQGSR